MNNFKRWLDRQCTKEEAEFLDKAKADNIPTLEKLETTMEMSYNAGYKNGIKDGVDMIEALRQENAEVNNNFQKYVEDSQVYKDNEIAVVQKKLDEAYEAVVDYAKEVERLTKVLTEIKDSQDGHGLLLDSAKYVEIATEALDKDK